RHVDDRGFLRLQPLGSFDPRVLLAQRVIVHPEDGEGIPGVIETTKEPLHFGPPRDPALTIDDLFVDVGEEASRIQIGDMVTLDRELVQSGDRIVSKALDDRLGIYVMIEALRLVRNPAWTIGAVAATHDEVGTRGAGVAGSGIGSDICVARDLNIENHIPGSAEGEEITRLGKGPAIKALPPTQISHRGIVRHLRDHANQHEIPYQLE